MHSPDIYPYTRHSVGWWNLRHKRIPFTSLKNLSFGREKTLNSRWNQCLKDAGLPQGCLTPKRWLSLKQGRIWVWKGELEGTRQLRVGMGWQKSFWAEGPGRTQWRSWRGWHVCGIAGTSPRLVLIRGSRWSWKWKVEAGATSGRVLWAIFGSDEFRSFF